MMSLSPRKFSPTLKIKAGIAWLRSNKKRLFWWWVAYQAVKGILTTSLIWIPLIYLYLKG